MMADNGRSLNDLNDLNDDLDDEVEESIRAVPYGSVVKIRQLEGDRWRVTFPWGEEVETGSVEVLADTVRAWATDPDVVGSLTLMFIPPGLASTGSES